MPKLRLLEVSGSPFEIGRQYASAYPHEIRELTEDRLQLSSNKDWTGKGYRARKCWRSVTCLPYHEAYAPELMDELHGKDVTGLAY
jgi:hypothetical protein